MSLHFRQHSGNVPVPAEDKRQARTQVFKVWETVTGNPTLDRLAAQIRDADVQSLRPLDHQQRNSTRAARWSCFIERYKWIKANVFC
ncbi:hypothetical protein [Paraburkholderia xenovorans]|uniref:hypothetical protein n=1 Tax=Paraburkholderia xenovorans TaxID=36873 RepID=UPI0038BACFC8